ncbi:MAG: 6-phosphofructokinase, partial [Gemmataceae bacterium]
GRELGSEVTSTDPSGNKVLSGAAEALRRVLIARLGDTYFTSKRRNESASAAIFTRKVGHTQRGGRPVYFDRFYGTQLGGHAVDLLLDGQANAVAVLQYDHKQGFHISSVHSNDFRDRYGLIHARQVHPSFYDRERLQLSDTAVEYLEPIFTDALGADDMEEVRRTLFQVGNLTRPHHSVNVDVNKRICYLE